MYGAKLGAILFAQLGIIFETYSKTIISPHFHTIYVSFHFFLSWHSFNANQKSNWKKGKRSTWNGILKRSKLVLKTKKMSSFTFSAFRVKDEKYIFDAFINGINFAQIWSFFNDF